MGFGVTELIIIAVIVLLLFGTTKLKSLGSDLGGAIKGFKNAVSEEEEQAKLEADDTNAQSPLSDASTNQQKESVKAEKDN